MENREELLRANRDLQQKLARSLEENARMKKNQEYMDDIIKERNFWFGVVNDIWERANKAMVRRE